jgi:hypothetical protein
VVPSGAISSRVLVENPNYGDPIGDYGSRLVKPDKVWYNKIEGKYDYYSRLEESILKDGFKNPIFCQALDEGTFSRYGTSRLWIAQKNTLELPVIIADYTGAWDHLEELRSEEEILSKFQDLPRLLEITKEDMRFDGCKHFHLDDDTITHMDLIA